MTNPELLQCPDRHYRGVVFEIRPFIADYPEQVILASIVQGWCPKCLASPDHLEYSGEPRCRGLHEMLRESFDSDIIWFTFGIVAGIKVCMVSIILLQVDTENHGSLLAFYRILSSRWHPWAHYAGPSSSSCQRNIQGSLGSLGWRLHEA